MSKQPFYRVQTSIILMLSLAALVLLLWNRGAEEKSVRISAVPAAVSPVSKLCVGSRWYGTLQIEELKGEGPLAEGSRAVWASLGSSPDGSPYFELSEKQRPLKSDVPLLSFWCEVDGDHLTPEIGEQDSWFFEQWLTEEDAEALTLRLENGALSAEFDYDDGVQQCHIRFTVRPA